MKIAIVDDELLWRNKARSVIQSHLNIKESDITCYASGEDFLADKKSFDLVCLDIKMGELDGFQTAIKYKALKKDVIIVILTIHTELSRNGYAAGAFRYIDKSHMEEEMEEALCSAQKLLAQNVTVELNVVKMGPRHFKYKDIVYIEVENRKVFLHTLEERFQISESIGEIGELLKKQGFFRSHKSYLVNLFYISSISKNGDIILQNGEKAMVGLKKKAELKKKFIDHQFKYGNM